MTSKNLEVRATLFLAPISEDQVNTERKKGITPSGIIKSDLVILPSGRAYRVEYSEEITQFDSRRFNTYGIILVLDKPIGKLSAETPGLQFKEIKFSYKTK